MAAILTRARASEESKLSAAEDEDAAKLRSLQTFLQAKAAEAEICETGEQARDTKGQRGGRALRAGSVSSTKSARRSRLSSVVERVRLRSRRSASHDDAALPAALPAASSSGGLLHFIHARRTKRSSSKLSPKAATQQEQHLHPQAQLSWEDSPGLMVDLLTQYPYCVTDVLVGKNGALGAADRKRLIAVLFRYVLHDVERDVRQQRLLMALLEDLLHLELSRADAHTTFLRGSSSPAALFVMAYVRRPECRAAATEALVDVLTLSDPPSKKKKNETSDAAVLATRLIATLHSRAASLPVGLQLVAEQIHAMAPRSHRERFVGAVLVLRFLNPQIVAFQHPRAQPQATRVAVARLLQHLANQSATAAATLPKDDAAFLELHQQDMRALLHRIRTTTRSPPP